MEREDFLIRLANLPVGEDYDLLLRFAESDEVDRLLSENFLNRLRSKGISVRNKLDVSPINSVLKGTFVNRLCRFAQDSTFSANSLAVCGATLPA
jgi:hypothetical protein